MRFRSIEVAGFGAISGQSLEFAEGLNVLVGPNEAGKTAWHAALYAGLCGRRRAQGSTVFDATFENRHRPWTGAPWEVTARVVTDDGTEYEIRHDLDGHKGCHLVDVTSGLDLASGHIHEGCPDGSILLGLRRELLWPTLFIRQADVYAAFLEKNPKDPKALLAGSLLQGPLERAFDSRSGDANVNRALERLSKHLVDDVGTVRAPTKPLAIAKKEQQAAAEELARAQAAHAEIDARYQAIAGAEGDLTAANRRLREARAWLAIEEAERLGKVVAEITELSKRFPDQEPPLTASGREDLVLAARQAIQDWRNRGAEPDGVPDLPEEEDVGVPIEGDLAPHPAAVEAEAELRAARRFHVSLEQRVWAVAPSAAGAPARRARPRRLIGTGAVAALGGGAAIALGSTAAGIALLALGAVLLGAAGVLWLVRREIAGGGSGDDRPDAGAGAQLAEALAAVGRAEEALLDALRGRLEETPGESAEDAMGRYRGECAVRGGRARRAEALRRQEALDALRSSVRALGLQPSGDDVGTLVAALEGAVAEIDAQRLAAQAELEAWSRMRALLAGEDVASWQHRLAVAEGAVAELGGQPGGPRPADPLAVLRSAEAGVESARSLLDGIAGGIGVLEDKAPDVPALEERLAAAQDRLGRLLRRQGVVEKARALLEEAQRAVFATAAPVLKEAIEARLPEITSDRYREVGVDAKTLSMTVRTPDGVWKDAGLLSHGTTEQIYFLLRLALAEVLVGAGERPFLVLDDLTVQSDTARTIALLELMHRLSATNQIILFSQEDEVRSWAEANLLGERDRFQELPKL